MNTTFPLPDAVDPARFKTLLQLACDEDLGTRGDITTVLLAEPMQTARGAWIIRAREAGRCCGAALLEPILAELAPEIRVVDLDPSIDGRTINPATAIARLEGSVVQMLAAERIILNFLQRLSGIATLTRHFVDAIAGTHAKILDTRKTTPGWRDLEKYAVRCGGGHNHRHGLHDAVLIKDNHLAGVPVARLAHVVFEMLSRIEQDHTASASLGRRDNSDSSVARPSGDHTVSSSAQPSGGHSASPPFITGGKGGFFVEVECDSPDQFAELLKVVGIDVILLDNCTLADMKAAVALRDEAGLRGKIELEASGGVTLATVRDIAETGVERIAVGAITHSAIALDIGLDAA